MTIAALLMLTAIGLSDPAATGRLSVRSIPSEIRIDELDSPVWKKADEVLVDAYWSGERAPQTRRFKSRLLWSTTALYVRFDAEQHEPLIVSDRPDLSMKAVGLWDRDVVEIFIAPDSKQPNKYFEFEVAPTGEWVDLGIEVTPEKRITDRAYVSRMESSARVDKDRVTIAMKIRFKALGRTPEAGDVWLGNLFRCVGSGPTRGYLAWRPTNTPQPSFHIPSAFGEFHFVK